MQIASKMAGFDMAHADLLRKAIGKKIPEIMDEQRNEFVQGCKKNRVPPQVANQIFDLIEYFSGYGFNKSHSTAYALISYRTAYLKANYPTEFMAALLTSERTNTDKIVEYVNESDRMGIKVLPPDINTSYANFTVTDDGNIRFGLMAIKNVGKSALESIIEIRKQEKFQTIFDFCERVDSRSVNKKVIESLIKSGAMDSFGLKRAQMVAILDKLLSRAGKKKDTSQLLLFETPKEENIPDIEEWPLSQILGFEKSLLGIYLTGHPLYSYSHIVEFLKRTQISSLYEMRSLQDVTICGVVEKVRAITTRKRNESMAIVKIEDETANVEVFVFPRLYEKASLLLREKSIVVIKGKLESKEKVPKILAASVIPVEQVMNEAKSINILVNNSSLPLDKLKSIIADNQGQIPVFFEFKNSRMQGVKIKTANQFYLRPSEDVLDQIGSLVGKENLSLIL